MARQEGYLQSLTLTPDSKYLGGQRPTTVTIDGVTYPTSTERILFADLQSVQVPASEVLERFGGWKVSYDLQPEGGATVAKNEIWFLAPPPVPWLLLGIGAGVLLWLARRR